MSIILFILALTALIVVHECGHFFTAKAFGIRVDEFGIGFPPRLIHVRWGETEYSVNLLFFGGFVRISGERLEDEGTSSDPRSFANKSRLVQAAVIVAGIAMNLVAAWLITSGLYMAGMPTVADSSDTTLKNSHLEIVAVLPGSPADKAGLQGGDTVEAVETGTAELAMPATAEQARDFVTAHGDQSVIVKVLRGGAQKVFLAKPASGVISSDPSRKALGVEFAIVGYEQLPPISALIEGGKTTAQETADTAAGLAGFFTDIVRGHPDFTDVSGPVGIAKVGSQAAAEGASALLLFASFISINLALINVLPVPGLDGGRLLIILTEAIRGRAVSARLYGRLMTLGFGLLVLLMIIVTYHDIARMF